MFERLYYQESRAEAQELVHRLLEGDAFDPDANLDPLSYASTTVNAEQMAKELGFAYEGKNTADPKDPRDIWSKTFPDRVQLRMTVGSDPTLVNIFVYRLEHGQMRRKLTELIDITANQVRAVVREWSTAQEALEDEIPDLMGYATKAARKPWGYMLRLPAFMEQNGKKYPRRDVWLNARRSDFQQYIGNGTVFKRQSTTKQWPNLQAVPVYEDPRKYGDRVLDPNFVPPAPRRPRLESLDDEIRDLKAYAMQHGLPPRILITFNKTTPESAETGEWSDSGWIDQDGVSMAPDEIDQEEGLTAVDLAVKYLWKEGATEHSSSGFDQGGWYSTGWSTTDYHTGEEEERNYHLEGFTPEQEREIYDKLMALRRRR